MAGSWSSTLSSGDITISANGLMATLTSGAGAWAMAKSTLPIPTNPYVEVTVGTFSTAMSIGLANQSEVTGSDPNAWPGASNNSIGLNNFNNVYLGGSQIATAVSYVVGDVIGIAIDTSAQTIQFRDVTTSSAWFGPYSISILGSPVYLAVGFYSVGNFATANFSGPFVGAIPPGFVGWDSAAPSGWGQKIYCNNQTIFNVPSGTLPPNAWASRTLYDTHNSVTWV